MLLTILLIFLSLTPLLGQQGFAVGVTGGGNTPAVYPSSIDQLVSYLQDNSPRVIIIQKEFNFVGSMGRKTETGCRPSSNKCPGKGGQDSINPPFNWCGNYPKVEVNYDVSGTQFIDVNSHKTLKGVGSGAVIRGRGLKLVGDNIIIQNIHFTDLNPQYIWGGDGIAVYGTDLLWIDHCKFSLMGRQFLLTNGPARGQGRITLSYNDFDGNTQYSATCNNHHYWTIYITGKGYHITFMSNYIHQTSGRSPKLGETGVDNDFIFHSVNNYFYDVAGHAFDTCANDGVALIEGNYFEMVQTPRLHDTNQEAYAPTALLEDCANYLGRRCQPNKLLSSGVLNGDKSRLSKLIGMQLPKARDATIAKKDIVNNAGVGKI